MRWGLLAFAAIFTLNSCTFGDDEKASEIVEDPMANTEEYYIAGIVFNAENSETLSGVTVKVADESTTTDAHGRYQLAVDSKKQFKVEFSKTDFVSVSAEATIANNAANRSMLLLGVKLAPKSVAKAVTSTGGTVADKNDVATIDIPANAVPSGETNTIAITQYEAPLPVSTTLEVGTKTIAAPLMAIAVEATKKTFDGNVKLTIKDVDGVDAQFSKMTLYGIDNLTRAPKDWEKIGEPTSSNGNYHFETTKLKSKYSLEVEAQKQTGAEKNTEYNTVNGKSEFMVDNSGVFDAKENIDIKVEAKAGWIFTVNPETAVETSLKTIGEVIQYSDRAKIAATIRRVIESQEGGVEKSYFIIHNLKASVSGNHIMYYRNRAKFSEKTYTFDLVVKGNKNAKVVVKVKAYTGMEEVYQNEEATQHSGGKI
ncbi:carboxypeptidase regulatory-like domain-containing protein [Bacteroides sp. 224]|nr:carboxypeptidase regulatory-like domain-containing protein [Bacteroides sp. 224]